MGTFDPLISIAGPIGLPEETILPDPTCEPCSPGEYGTSVYHSRFASTGCDKCEDGYTTYGSGIIQCRRVGDPCPTGFFETPAGDCVRCKVDEFLNRDTFLCERCPVGQGSAGGLVTKCNPCRDVINANIDGSSCWCYFVDQEGEYITPIPADENGDCIPGTYRSSDEICIICNAGTFSDTLNAAACQSCGENSVAPNQSSSRCIVCPDGTMADNEDISCKVPQTWCPKAALRTTYKFDSRSDLEDYCHREGCPLVQGDLSYEQGLMCSASCDRYSTDTAIVNPGDKECNKYRGVLRRVMMGNRQSECGCRGLLAIEVGIVNGTCVKCQPGSYGSNQGRYLHPGVDNVCKKCPAGTYHTPLTGTGIMSCIDGRDPCVLMDNICRTCPPGEYTDTDGATECKKCPPGTFTYGVGNTKCLSLSSTSEPVVFDTPLANVGALEGSEEPEASVSPEESSELFVDLSDPFVWVDGDNLYSKEELQVKMSEEMSNRLFVDMCDLR